MHTTVSTRQSRKGEISSWKAFAPAHAGKLAIEAIDRAMRGEGAPSPIYEGEDSVIAQILGGKKALYKVPLPNKNEQKKAILETYTKEYSAEYQAQALQTTIPRPRDTGKPLPRQPTTAKHKATTRVLDVPLTQAVGKTT